MTADGLYTPPPHAKQTDDWLYSALLTCGATDTPRRAGGKLECAAVGTGSVYTQLRPPTPNNPLPPFQRYTENRKVGPANPLAIQCCSLIIYVSVSVKVRCSFSAPAPDRIFKHGFLQFFSFPPDGQHAAICLACHKFISSYTIRKHAMSRFKAIKAVTLEITTVYTDVSEETNKSNIGQNGTFALINMIHNRYNFIHLKDYAQMTGPKPYT
jgi:hypothetical protein